jgi:hypothetical protein
VARNMTAATITASLNGVMRSGTVRVLGDGTTIDIPTFTSVSPANGKIALGGMTTLTASLDLPAGAAVPLTITDNAAPAWTFTTPATIAADAISVGIPITQAGASLTDMITVSDGTNMYTSNLAVGVHPVINELDYDQTGTDNGEFVELYNPYATAIDLTGMAVVFATKTNNEYMRVALTGMLAANGYLVLGVGGTIALPQAIQNGSSTNPIGIAIIDTVAKTVLDSVSFTGASPGLQAQITGFPAVTTFAEGTWKLLVDNPGTTTTPILGSLVRIPNGQDTDDMTADWQFKSTGVSPGATN